MANAVLVADMVVGFLEPGHNLYVEEARKIIPNVRRLVEREQAGGSRVFFLCDTHDPDDLEFQMFPVHCVRGTEECEVIPELSGYEGEVVRKRRYNAFFETDLGGASRPAEARQGHRLRRMHRHMRDAHGRRRTQP